MVVYVGAEQVSGHPEHVRPIENTSAIDKDIAVEPCPATVVDRGLGTQRADQVHPVVQGTFQRRTHGGSAFVVVQVETVIESAV